MNDVDLLFSEAGGKFCIPVQELVQKLTGARAIIFDWDGVFNNGSKSEASGSPFSEPDSMGVNLLRLSFWLRNQKLPPTAILSGEENKNALLLARRESFNAVYFKSTDKIKAFNHFLKVNALKADEVIFVFDDVLDLSLAEVCGVRIQVNREASPLFSQWVALQGLVDYVTAQEGGNFAVREACELIMGLNGSYDASVRERMAFSESYKSYLAVRNSITTDLYYLVSGEIRESKG